MRVSEGRMLLVWKDEGYTSHGAVAFSFSGNKLLALHGLLKFLLTEFGRVERRGEVGPPRGGLRGEGEADPAEEAGILKNKRVAGGAQN